MAQTKGLRAGSVSDRSLSKAGPQVAYAPGSPERLQSPRRPTKKEQIISLYNSGIEDLTDIAAMIRARPSYVASVLQDAGLLPTGYYDLYTSTRRPINIYSKFFTGKLGFKDEAAARKSVALIDELYRQFAFAQDRAGQHHALAMALTMFDRARWTGKEREADIFRKWLMVQLAAPIAK